MRRLMLLRHAKSDWPQGVADHDRPLGPRGQRDAPRIAREIARRGLQPDHVIVSTSRRTRETLTLIEPQLDRHTLQCERAIYEASPDAILRVIRATSAEIRTLLIVGHNPGIEQTASYLIAGGGTIVDPLDEKFPTAALAVIEFDVESWTEIAGRQGQLALFLTPKMLG